MNSLDLITLKKNIEDELNKIDIPKEALRLIIKEVYEDVSKAALNEALQQAKEKEEGESKDVLQSVGHSEEDSECKE